MFNFAIEMNLTEIVNVQELCKKMIINRSRLCVYAISLTIAFLIALNNYKVDKTTTEKRLRKHTVVAESTVASVAPIPFFAQTAITSTVSAASVIPSTSFNTRSDT